MWGHCQHCSPATDTTYSCCTCYWLNRRTLGLQVVGYNRPTLGPGPTLGQHLTHIRVTQGCGAHCQHCSPATDTTYSSVGSCCCCSFNRRTLGLQKANTRTWANTRPAFNQHKSNTKWGRVRTSDLPMTLLQKTNVKIGEY